MRGRRSLEKRQKKKKKECLGMKRKRELNSCGSGTPSAPRRMKKGAKERMWAGRTKRVGEPQTGSGLGKGDTPVARYLRLVRGERGQNEKKSRGGAKPEEKRVVSEIVGTNPKKALAGKRENEVEPKK